MMNKTLLIGRLTRDPELKYTANNIPVATFTLAVNRPFSKQGGERKLILSISLYGASKLRM